MTGPWAKCENNIAVSVEIASDEWIKQWRIDNPDTPYVWYPTDPTTKGYASVGYSYDADTGWFVPPEPDEPGAWVFDRDPEVWAWINMDAPTE